METATHFLDNWWAVEIINLMICILAVLYVDCCKKLICKIAQKKGKTIDLKKWEYIISLISFTITFGIVIGFLLSLGYDILRSALEGAFFGFGTGGVYQLITQPSRKGLKKIFNFIIEVIVKVKKGTANDNIKSDINELLDTATDETGTDTQPDNTSQSAMDSLINFVDSLKK